MQQEKPAPPIAVPSQTIARPADDDPRDTNEWLDALASVSRTAGPKRAEYLVRKLEDALRTSGVSGMPQSFSAYRNTIPLDRQGPYPGDLAIEERLVAIMRWNALVMVMRANQAYGDLGGHIASYASAAEISELGFNHFFQASTAGKRGDLVFYQPHSAPRIYARAFLEGRPPSPQSLPSSSTQARAA